MLTIGDTKIRRGRGIGMKKKKTHTSLFTKQEFVHITFVDQVEILKNSTRVQLIK